MSEITNIQSKVQEWLNSERGKQYKKSSPQELLSILAQENVLTPAEINTLKSASVFTSKYKMSINNNSSLEGWGIEQKNPNKTDVNKQLETRLNNVKKELDAKVKENRFLRSAWHWAKNKIGFGANSNKVEQAIENERKKISQIKNPEVFMELTGAEYTDENYEKLIKGEIKLKSEQALEAYKQGQDGVVDFMADMVSGIAAVGIYTAAVAAAPFTGGASIVVGFAAAAASGAVIKTGLKAGAALISGKEYTKEDLKHDAITGGFSGALGPLTGGVGGAVGKSVATKLGIQAVKEGVKDIAANTAKTGLKQWVKTALTNPAGYKYAGGNIAKKAAAFGAEAMTDGALGGAIDGGFRAGYENDWDGETILNGTVEGGVGGAMMAPAIGGGMKLSGKVGHRLGTKIKNFFGLGKETKQVGEALADETDDINVKSSTISWLVSMRQKRAIKAYEKWDGKEPSKNIREFINLTVAKNPKTFYSKGKPIINLLWDDLIKNEEYPFYHPIRFMDFIEHLFINPHTSNVVQMASCSTRLLKSKDFIEPLSRIASKYGKNKDIYSFGHLIDFIANDAYSDETKINFIKKFADANLTVKQMDNIITYSNFTTSLTEISMKNFMSMMPELKNLNNEQLRYILEIVQADEIYSSISILDRKKLLKVIESIPEKTKENIKERGFDIINLQNRLKNDVVIKGFEIPTEPNLQKRFLRSYIGHEKEPLFKSTEFSDYLKTNSECGLPLKYSRKSFVSDLNDLLVQLPQKEKDKVLKQLNIELAEGSYTGFVKWNGIDVESFPKELHSIAEAIQAKAKAFSADNEIVCDNPEIKSVLDDLVKGFPEFTSIIGKKNPGHDNTIDIHTLEVLNNAIQHPEYANLSDAEKTILKLSILMHDMGKFEYVTDGGKHAAQSAIYANSILDKFNFPQETKERIVNLIRFHHFGEENPAKFHMYFRTEGDKEIALLFEQADYKSSIGGVLDVDVYRKALNPYHVKQNFAEYDFSVMAKRLPKKTFKLSNGKEVEIPILKISEFSPDTDMEPYGFPGKKLKDIVVQIHYTNERAHDTNVRNLRVVIESYKDPNYDIVLSTSIRRLSKLGNSYSGLGIIGTTSKMNRGGGSLGKIIVTGEKKGFDRFLNWLKIDTDLGKTDNLADVNYPGQFKDDNIMTKSEKINEYLRLQKIGADNQNYSELLALNMKPAIIVAYEKDITPELIDIIHENNLFLISR